MAPAKRASCLPHQTVSVPEDRNHHIDHRVRHWLFFNIKSHDFLTTQYLLYLQTLDLTSECVMILFSTGYKPEGRGFESR
jgi:hypothetical protein